MSTPRWLNKEIESYRLVEFLGAGGMGSVYRGVHKNLDRMVAVKILHEPGLLARFQNEARIQAGLQHQHIATLYEFLEFEGKACIVMEFVPGKGLDELIHAQGRLPYAEALRIYQSVVGAMAHVHNRGIIHRDIKPSNIRVQEDGTVKLLDFGIAKGSNTPKLTQTGGVVGTLQYLAPEQIKGHTDARSDVWSLGVLFYEMVTGRAPFMAENMMDLFGKISQAVFVPPSILNPGLPSSLEAVISRCLKRNPNDRYPSAVALHTALKTGLQATRMAPVPVRRAEPSPPVQHLILRAVEPETRERPRPGVNLRVPAWLTDLKLPEIPAPVWGGVGALLLCLVLFWMWPASTETGLTDEPDPAQTRADLTPVKITIAGVNNAWIRFPSGETHAVPYVIHARRDTVLQFVLGAQGYQDKIVNQFKINPRREEYVYSLERATR